MYKFLEFSPSILPLLFVIGKLILAKIPGRAAPPPRPILPSDLAPGPIAQMFLPSCRHEHVVPVNTLTGELVAHICLQCDRELSAKFVPPGSEPAERQPGGFLIPNKQLSEQEYYQLRERFYASLGHGSTTILHYNGSAYQHRQEPVPLPKIDKQEPDIIWGGLLSYWNSEDGAATSRRIRDVAAECAERWKKNPPTG